ncbi:MAG: hypothetical protein K8S87_06625, partial [Planctomycetes bacterium]|nr:hypothetical protein [Planctomycetota bacterium]
RETQDLYKKAFADLTDEEADMVVSYVQKTVISKNYENFFTDEIDEFKDTLEFLETLKKVNREHILKAALITTEVSMLARRRLNDFLSAMQSEKVNPLIPLENFKDGIATIHTSLGDIVIGNSEDNTYPADLQPFILVDMGGNDKYNCRVGFGFNRPNSSIRNTGIGFHYDYAGNDYYAGDLNFNCGSGYNGIGISIDEDGDDIRKCGNLSLGSGLLGFGMLIDEKGNDICTADVCAQGAGAYGWGAYIDMHGDDRYDVNLFGQGFAYVWSAGMIYDGGGDDVYNAGGEYVHYPLFNDRFQALSQGFSIGMRPYASGGIGILLDESGNDVYKSDIYGQGSSYWYSLGILCDNNGNDYYTMSQYGQGSGIHLAAGALVDYAGNDIYYNPYGVGIGGCHDYAVGILIDKKGFDYYAGCGLSMGTGGTNGVGILIEGEGDDVYAVQQRGVGNTTIGGGRGARGYGSIGVLLECGGNDTYSDNITKNNHISTKPMYGVTYDFEIAESQYIEQSKSFDKFYVREKYKAEAKYWDEVKEQWAKEKSVPSEPKPADLDKDIIEKLEKLWQKGIEWAVGDNRVLVLEAREEIIKMDEPAMVYMLTKLNSDKGLQMECLKHVFSAWGEKYGEVLVKKLSEDSLQVVANTLYILAAMKYKSESALVKYFELSKNEKLESRVVTVLRAIQMKEAVPTFRELLKSSRSTASRVIILAGLAELQAEEALYDMFSVLTDKELFTIRHTCEDHLAKFEGDMVPNLAYNSAGNTELEIKTRLHCISLLGRLPREKSASLLLKLTLDDDWRIAGFALKSLTAFKETEGWDNILNAYKLLKPQIDLSHLFVKSAIAELEED